MSGKTNTNIFAAIHNESKSYAELIRLINAGADLTATNEQNKTPIRFAASLHLWECVTIIANLKQTNAEDKANYGAALLLAVYKDQFEATQALLQALSPTTWYTLDDDYTPLHLAVKNRNKSILKLLLDHNADITKKNKARETPILLAASLGYWDCVELIAKAKKTEEKDLAHYTSALFRAIRAHKKDDINNLTVIKALIEANASLTATNSEKKTPIQVAEQLKLWDCIELIAKTRKSPEKDQAKYGDPLLSAAYYDKYQTVKILLKAGALTTWYLAKSKNTALHLAVKNKNSKMLKLLIKHGANLTACNDEDSHKYTPIQLAAKLGFWEGVATIAAHKSSEEAGARANYGDALRYAVMDKKLETVERLVKAKAPLTWHTIPTHNTCLHEAVINNHPEMIALLLKMGADPSVTNLAHQTPLELACALGHWKSARALTQIELFKFKEDNQKTELALIETTKAEHLDIAAYLIEAGASINQPAASDGYTALHWAVKKNNIKVLLFLLENKASQTVTTATDETPLELACTLGHWDIAQTLIEFHTHSNKNSVADLHAENALLIAIKQGNYAIAKLLLECHAPCNKWNSEMGTISLYWAIKANRPDLVSLLITFGADPNIRNMRGKSAYDVAQNLKHTKCILALNNEMPSSNLDMATLAEKSDMLFQALSLNAIKGINIPTQINKIKENDNALLSSTLNALALKRNCVKNTELSLSTHANFLSTLQSDNITILIKTINLLLNFPEKLIPRADRIQIDTLHHQGMIEASTIVTYLERKEKIDTHLEKLRAWLIQLKQNLSATTWQVKNIFGNWVNGQPKHVKTMLKQLDKVNSLSAPKEVLAIYTQIIQTLTRIPDSKRRHSDTMHYYQTKMNEVKAFSFDLRSTLTQAEPCLTPFLPETEPLLTMSSAKNLTNALYPLMSPEYVPMYPMIPLYPKLAETKIANMPPTYQETMLKLQNSAMTTYQEPVEPLINFDEILFNPTSANELPVAEEPLSFPQNQTEPVLKQQALPTMAKIPSLVPLINQLPSVPTDELVSQVPETKQKEERVALAI